MATVSEEPIKKDTLLLRSLEIRSFRGFQHLRIEHLGRVNLIVGKNNVGKTALLEALRLYAGKGFPGVIWELLGIDQESRQFRHLTVERQLYLDILVGAMNFVYSLDRIGSTSPFGQSPKRSPGIFRGPDGLSKREIGRLWDDIALTNLEQEVLASLRIIAPGVERLNLVEDLASSRERIPIVKIQGIEEPLPLSNLGDGMHRMLGIALGLVNAKDGMLLVDEIENGLHYSVLPDLWRMIFQIARRLNIQVFATTHSWDCIEGFQQAAQEDKQTEGMLIRLDAKKDGIAATLFDERRLGIATREQIEVR